MILWIIFCWALTGIERKWGNSADPAPIKDNNNKNRTQFNTMENNALQYNII